MPKPDFLKKLAEELVGSLPLHLQSVKADLEKNCQRVLKQFFTKMDIVTREEFDTQVKVLARTRQKMEELTELVKTMEAKKHS
jgi:BMFP domain-containing protein YqiC